MVLIHLLMATESFLRMVLMMDIEQIRQHLPHRYPFLLVDRVVEPAELMAAAKAAAPANPPLRQ